MSQYYSSFHVYVVQKHKPLSTYSNNLISRLSMIVRVNIVRPEWDCNWQWLTFRQPNNLVQNFLCFLKITFHLKKRNSGLTWERILKILLTYTTKNTLNGIRDYFISRSPSPPGIYSNKRRIWDKKFIALPSNKGRGPQKTLILLVFTENNIMKPVVNAVFLLRSTFK